ncbi:MULTISPECIES: tetratricopeptide repeat protein [unclassified Salinivibrio]|uniref:flagellar protein MotX n=1 Tax=unclassified Salinivibrio TaxID=2636825 RepID=UPI0006147022|nr:MULTISPECIES: tetratricopeptide repeat protein [unclassified Salinivibrio]KKA45177.1 flagellar protein MotX [Salinivibrio sp. KP-1]MPX91011.1 sel1 repeat family protein [Salinivibrio sp. VYel1]OOE75602.1 flagellar protein MotX [Salinivibrio sp. ML290]OOE80746.1 flagellar protein MotX [Salinivibrio sp. ML198]OOE82678.1 flagellar protein MotX [Salinivibrio sp. PR6]
MKFRTLIFSLSLTTATLTTATAHADVGAAVPLYEESELITLFETNSHLERVKQDECQLVQDIEARATRVGSPAYEFLYGDMLAWGVCVEQDADLGVYYMKQAAQQGLPAALEQIGRYYANGTLVQQDQHRAIPYLREAASLGDTRARIQLAELLVDDVGSPLDYEDAYRWLYQTITADSRTRNRIAQLRSALEARMPQNIIARAKRRTSYW